jgi:hypothetical protein
MFGGATAPLCPNGGPPMFLFEYSVFRDESNEQMNDFLSFDWINESSSDRILKLNDGRKAHYVVC